VKHVARMVMIRNTRIYRLFSRETSRDDFTWEGNIKVDVGEI
jgi:hypothetical protein